MAKSGGGITSNKLVSTHNPKQEPRVNVVSPGAVSRLGGQVGVGTPHLPLYVNKVTASSPIGPSDNTKVGPGANRTVMRSGSQSQHGPSAPGISRPGKDKPFNF
jgi:hypothetical protein